MWSALIDIGKDKWMHFGVSTCISFLIALILPTYIAIAVTIIVGVAKEVYDKASGRGSAEWKDLIADIIGAIVGGL